MSDITNTKKATTVAAAVTAALAGYTSAEAQLEETEELQNCMATATLSTWS